VVKKALAVKLPEAQSQLESRFVDLEKELLELDVQIKGFLSSNAKSPLLFSHPVYQYFERRYELNGRSVHWEPAEAPTEAMWVEFKELLAKHPAKVLVWEGETDPEIIKKLQEQGVKSVVFNPCGNVPAEGDFIFVMRNNIKRLRIAYQKQ
jgi:zinc transport system substrate-binding protein